MLVGAAVVLAAAGWLREPSVLYLGAAAAATSLAWWVAVRAALLRARRGWHRVAVAALGTLFCAGAIGPQLTLRELDRDWSGWEGRALDGADARLQAALDAAGQRVESLVAEALTAPPGDAAEVLYDAVRQAGGAETAVLLEEGGSPRSWAGTLRVPPELIGTGLSVVRTPFYDVLAAGDTAGGRRAVATLLLHARPPADALARSLADDVMASSAAQAIYFDEVAPGPRPTPDASLQLADGGWLDARVAPLVRDEVALRTMERARGRGLLWLSLLVLAFLASVWGPAIALPTRLAGLGVALAAVAVVPLNALSNASPLFDPTYYFAQSGGPFTATVGALALSSGLVLLALLTVLRARAPLAGRSVALPLVVVLGLAGSGPFLLRDLARGIVAPTTGVTTGLWLAWQAALFLAATSVLLAGISAGRALLRPGRGLPNYVGPILAAAGALLAQPLWSEPDGWPAWYPALWIAAVAALALGRRARTLVGAAAAVASLGAMTLVWGSTIHGRVQLAERDVAGLARVDPVVRPLLERFADQLIAASSPNTRAELLADYASSDLAAADFAVQMAAWSPITDASGEPAMLLAAELAQVVGGAVLPGLRAIATDAARTGQALILPVPTAVGTRLVLAVPHEDGWVTTAAVAARTRLFPESPYTPLILGSAPPATEPPYSISLAPVQGAAGSPVAPPERWRRTGDMLHGDWVEALPAGPVRVHVEVEMRPLLALAERGALLLLLDLAVVGVLWGVAVVVEPGLPRWLRTRWRGWSRSYRSRLSLALFAFFALPAMAFGVWASRQLQSDARQTRELLVAEALRAAAPAWGPFASQAPPPEEILARHTGEPPLLLYERGLLVAASDELLSALAPLGRTLPPTATRALAADAPATTSVETNVGEARVLVGYRTLAAGDSAGTSSVLAVPARADELALDRRRRDLGVMLLLAVAGGALAALWLSGIAARQLARPIGTLRGAALAIAAGEREPPLTGAEPPAEFLPVFSAFHRMAADLSASRGALEEAERRTAAVLRQVASAVVAVDAAGAVTLFNPAATLLLGRSLRQGAQLPALGLPRLEELRAGLGQPAASGGEPGDEVMELALGARQIHARLTPLPSGEGAVLTLDDVTALARAQRVLAWGEMARQVAHEIKNPLTPIRLGVQHLRRAYGRGREGYEQVLHQNVERILAEIDRLDEIARAFSRYGTAPGQRGGEPVDVSRVVRDVMELERMGSRPDSEEQSEPSVSAGGGEVRWRAEGAESPCWGVAREDELREVLLNLLENARLAGAAEVRLTVGPAADGWVRVLVRDDGHGIPEDDLPRIFDPHFSTRTSGSGLGLAISRRLAQGWGGRVEVRSTVGVGTEVELTLAAASGR